MHFGRVEQTDLDTKSLPLDSSRTRKYLSLNLIGKGKIFLGAPVLAHKEWQGLVYPDGTASSDCLTVYSTLFNSLELNSSFYSAPPKQQIEKWVSSVRGEFKFSPKVPRTISENIGRPTALNELKAFMKLTRGFSKNLGLIFLQLPQHFSPEQFSYLSHFLNSLPRDHHGLALEFRHPGWFRNHTLLDPVVNLLYRNQIFPVITDTYGKRYSLHTSLTGQKVLIRFLGNNGHPSDNARLREWARRLKKWVLGGLDEIFFYIHQEDHLTIPASMQVFAAYLKEENLEDNNSALRQLVNLKLQKMKEATLF